MANPYIGEIRMFGGNFAPAGWAFCNGALIAISENTALFQLIGTIYGGDGLTTFALPDLRGRVSIHQGGGLVIGQLGGSESHTLNVNEIPAHTHAVNALANANAKSPSASAYGGNTTDAIYTTAASAPMSAGMIAPNAGGQAHQNLMPILVVNFIISLFGIFPSQN